MPVDLLIFAAIALFFIFKLGGVLGKKTGHEDRTDLPERNQDQGGEEAAPQRLGQSDQREDNVIHMPAAFEEPEEESEQLKGDAGDGLRAIMAAEPNFDPDTFLEGAEAAFEMIVNAYAEGDRKTLKGLLDKPTYEGFSSAIDAREKAGQRMEDTLVGIDSADVEEAEMRTDSARVTVRFLSQQVNVTYDSEGRVIDGDPSKVEAVLDIWTFARGTRSRDPNWQLVETRNAS